MTKQYKLKQPLLGWAKGEILVYDPEWNEWTRKLTGESFDYRSTTKTGEVTMLLNLLVQHNITTILEGAATKLTGGKTE